VFATMRHVLLADPAIMPLQYPTKLTGGFYVMSTIKIILFLVPPLQDLTE
jgi:hypothetical protein